MLATLCLGLMLQTILAPPPALRPEDCIRVERLSDRVLLAWWQGTGRCNIAAIRSQKGLVVIDTEMSPRIMAPIKDRIEREFGRTDWAYVINTHAHIHHAGGNVLFKPAPVVGHENLPRDMEWLIRKQSTAAEKQKDRDRVVATLRNLRSWLPRVPADSPQARCIRGEIEFWKLHGRDVMDGYEIVKPSITFRDRHTLDLGDLRLELVFFGRGHSNSDVLIYCPQERLLVTGAIVYQRNHIPEVGEETTIDDFNRYLAVLDEFLQPDTPIDHLVPSHSPVLRKTDLVPVRDYYLRLADGLRQARQEGLTCDQAADRLAQPKAFPTYLLPEKGDWDHGLHNRNLRNLWRILDQQQPSPQSPEITPPAR